MKLYGLYSDKLKSLMAVSASALCGDGLSEVEYALETYYTGANLWTSDTISAAERVCNTPNVPWYSSHYATPVWSPKVYGVLTVVNLNEFEL